MVVCWQILDEKGGLITTCFKEKDAVRAKERLEAKGKVARIDKIFDAHLKDRLPVVKKTRAKKKPVDEEPIPEGCHELTIFVRVSDVITSELGFAADQKAGLVDGIMRAIVNTNGKLVPVNPPVKTKET